MVNGGQPLRPLTYRTIRDELVDGNSRQDKLMAKLMRAYEGIEDDAGSPVRFSQPKARRPSRPLKLPGVRSGSSPATNQESRSRRRAKPTQKPKPKPKAKPKPKPKPATTSNQSEGRSRAPARGPQSTRRAQSAPLWAPKRNAMAEKAAEKRAVTRKLHAKPKKTGADKFLAKLHRKADGLRVCLNKIGPKGRGVTLFVLLTDGTQLTCIAADNTRGLKYRLALNADPELEDKGMMEKMHVLHALAVAIKISEVPRSERKAKRKAIKKALPGDGWGDDLQLDVDAEIMVSQMNKPRNLNAEEEIELMEAQTEEVRVLLQV